MKEEYMKRFRPADEPLGSESSESSWDSANSKKQERRMQREIRNLDLPPTVRQIRIKLMRQRDAEQDPGWIRAIDDFLYRYRKRGPSVEREGAARDEYIKSLLAEIAEDSLPEDLNDEWCGQP